MQRMVWLAAGFVAGLGASLAAGGAFRVEAAGASMLPTIRPGDLLVVSRRAPVRRGTVVVVNHPRRELELVKRVAAVPGDVVGGEVLGPARYLVVGDNRAWSTDGRAFGPVHRSEISGTVVFRYWPRPRLV